MATSSVVRGQRNAVKLEIMLGGEAELMQMLQQDQTQQQVQEEILLRRTAQQQREVLKAVLGEQRTHDAILGLRSRLASLLPPPQPTKRTNVWRQLIRNPIKFLKRHQVRLCSGVF